MNKQNLLLAGLTAGILILTGIVVTSNPITEKTVERVIENRVGSITSPEISSRELIINGNKFHYLRQEFGPSSVQGATTTPCAFQLSDGTNATTTTLSVTVQGNTATSAIVMWNMATSSTAFATTTPIINEWLVAANTGFSYALPSASATTSRVNASSTWLVIGARVTNAAGSGYIPVDISGVCTAVTQDL